MSPTVQSTELQARTSPLNQELIRLIPGVNSSSDITTVELSACGELYDLVCAHVAANADAGSFSLQVGRCSKGKCSEDEDTRRVAQPTLGLGLFEFTFQSHAADCACPSDVSDATDDSSGNLFVRVRPPAEPVRLFALHQELGEPVGTDCGATLYKTLVLIAEGKGQINLIKEFVDLLLEKADQTEDHKFTSYRWHVQHQYWRCEEKVTARPIDSVVLPTATKEKLVGDLDEFLSGGTKRWYHEHGIPYKRAYLLHGSPGAGKTSIIQALAGRYKRNVAILAPSHPDMTDDSLKAAVSRVPTKSIIVLEDVDAIFAEGRAKREGDKSSLTFSGVLNALDGVGGCSGQIFILTTNHRERLDPALIRNGRVDVHIEFKHADTEQMVGLFRQFYKEAALELAEEFAKGLMGALGQRTVSSAQLQHYFIMMRKSSAEAAAAGYAKVIEEMDAHGQCQKAEEETKAKTDDKGQGKEEGENAGGTKAGAKKADEEQGQDEDEEGAQGGKPTQKRGTSAPLHVHVHMH